MAVGSPTFSCGGKWRLGVAWEQNDIEGRSEKAWAAALTCQGSGTDCDDWLPTAQNVEEPGSTSKENVLPEATMTGDGNVESSSST